MEHLKPWFKIALPVVISINIFFLSFIALIAFTESSLTLEHQRVINVSINTITLGLLTSFLSILSPIFVFLLLRFITGVPQLEARGKEKWGHLDEYNSYKEKTGLLFPKFK